MNALNRFFSIRFLFIFLIAGFLVNSPGNEEASDAILNQWREKDLGTPITVVNIQSASFGKDESGRDVVFAQIYGKQGRLAIADLETRKVSKVLEIEGAKGAYANVFASDGNVYLGSNTNGSLYKYKPGEDAIQNLGKPFPETTFIWDMAEGPDGKLYGGTYPLAKVFEYDLKTGKFRGFGSVIEEEDYARSIVFDPDGGHVYAGVGSRAALVRLHPKTGEKTEILPKQYKDSQFVYSLDIVDGKIICKMSPQNLGVVLDLKTNSPDYVFPDYHSNNTSSKSPLEDVFYYSSHGNLMEYDMKKREHRSLNTALKGNARAFGYLTGRGVSPTLLAISTNSRILYYDLEKKTKRVERVDFPAQPVIIQTIFKGPDGMIYSSGYLSGGTGVYDPRTGKSKEYKDVGQSEGIASVGNRIYFGVYPRARIYEYDTAKEWNAESKNPKEIFRLEDRDQDRPFAMLGLENENKLLIGTIPNYGILGGALTIYDLNSPTPKPQVFRNVIQDQGVSSLTYHNQMVYGGTTIFGGLGIKPKEKEAKLFIFDLDKHEKIFETVPVPGAIVITCVKAAPDGTIWGWAEGVLFIFDPKLRKVIYSEQKLPVNYSSAKHVWRGAMMEYGEDGFFYGTYDDKFFRIDIKSKKLEILREGNLRLLARDDDGRFYYAKDVNLYQAAPPDAD